MKRYWQQLALKVDMLSLRERALLFATVVVVLLAAMDSALFEPRVAQEKRLLQQAVQEKAKIASLRAEIQLKAKERSDPDVESRMRLQQLTKEIAQAQESMRNVQNGLISPDKMAALLEDILKRNNKLRLMSLKTLPPASVNVPTAQKVEERKSDQATPTKGVALNESQASDSIYRHGVEIAVQGGYQDLMQYLEQLEKLPWQLFWGKVSLNVDEYPKATLTLDLFTISLEKTWLNI